VRASTDYHTTNLVDVNWSLTVIIKFRLPPELLMTPRIPLAAHRRARGTSWRMDFSTFSRFDTIPACVGQTVDEQTDTRWRQT